MIFLAAPLYCFLGIVVQSGLTRWLLYKIYWARQPILELAQKSISLFRVIPKVFADHLSMVDTNQEWHIIEGPGLVGVFTSQTLISATTLHLRMADYNLELEINSNTSKVKFQNDCQFSLLPEDSFNQLKIEILINHFISMESAGDNKTEQKIQELVSQLMRSLQLPNSNNKMNALVTFQKAVIILLLSTLKPSPTVLDTRTLDQMTEDEISCFLTMVKLLFLKTKKPKVILVGAPNSALLRYLVVHSKDPEAGNSLQLRVQSTIGFEVSQSQVRVQQLPTIGPSELITEASHNFFTVTFADIRPLCLLLERQT